MSNTTFSPYNYYPTARRGVMRGWPLLATSLAALLGACASQGSSMSGSSTMGSAASPHAQFPVAENTDTDTRSYIPPEDITRNGDGRALMWRTGTPIPEFGDSSY